MVKISLTQEDFLNFKKTLIFNEAIILKIISEDKNNNENIVEKTFEVLVILDNTILKIPIIFNDTNETIFHSPNTVEEIKNIYSSYLVTLHEYSLRIDTLSEDEKIVLGLLKSRIAFYSNTIKQLDLLSQINL